MPSPKDDASTGSPAKAARKTNDTTLSGRRGNSAFRDNPFASSGSADRASKKARGEALPFTLLAPEGKDPFERTPSSGSGNKFPNPDSLKTAPTNMDFIEENAGATDHTGGENPAHFAG